MSKDEPFDPVFVRGGDKPSRYQQDKVRVPGGKLVVGAKAHAQGWRKYAEPLATATGWKVHSFHDGFVRFVSTDYQHKQDISLEYIEALWPLVKGFPWTCNEPSSSAASATPPTSTASPRRYSAPSTRTSGWREDSLPAGMSASPSATSSSSVLSMPLPLKPPSRPKLPDPEGENK